MTNTRRVARHLLAQGEVERFAIVITAISRSLKMSVRQLASGGSGEASAKATASSTRSLTSFSIV